VAAIPGAIVVGTVFLEVLRPEIVAFVVVAIVFSAPLVASFDERYHTSTVAMPLMAVSFVGVFFTIPDTEEAIVAVGVALPFALIGPPGRIAHLGGPGAFVSTGILVWVVASGGFSRPGSLILGTASLGLLVAEPVARRVRAAQLTRSHRLLGLGVFGVGAVIAVQVVIGLTMSRLTSFAGSGTLVAAGTAALVLVLAGVWASTPVPDG